MTSERIQEIQEAERTFATKISDKQAASDALTRAALLEIAYQLAVMNERNAAQNPLGQLCECGHRLGQHGTPYDGGRICHTPDCLCRERRPR